VVRSARSAEGVVSNGFRFSGMRAMNMGTVEVKNWHGDKLVFECCSKDDCC
jgi:hypothetical protein